MFPITTTLSSRGQVVIPLQVRQMLHLEPGTEFLVVAKGDTVVLQRFAEPPWREFDKITSEAQRQRDNVDLAMLALKKVMDKLRRNR